MNPMTFNLPFEGMLADILARRGYYAPTWAWRTAPLFVYASTEQREEELSDWRVAHPDFRQRLPFETIRLSLTQTDANAPERGRYQCNYVAASAPPDYDRLYLLARVRRLFDREPGQKDNTMDFILTEVEWQSKEPTPDGGKGYMVGYNAMGRYNGQWIQNPVDKATEVVLHKLITGAMNAFVCFAIDAALPTAHIAKVRPDQPGRSVQWIEARTHYTLISHGHPANRPEVTRGSTVTVNPAEELQRIAHARRAHFRTLRAARYRFARGRQVWVREAWVGPREWREQGSKQIYSILNPL